MEEAISFQDANKTEKANWEKGWAIGTLFIVLDNLDTYMYKHNGIPTTSSRQEKPDA